MSGVLVKEKARMGRSREEGHSYFESEARKEEGAKSSETKKKFKIEQEKVHLRKEGGVSTKKKVL